MCEVGNEYLDCGCAGVWGSIIFVLQANLSLCSKLAGRFPSALRGEMDRPGTTIQLEAGKEDTAFMDDVDGGKKAKAGSFP